LNLLS